MITIKAMWIASLNREVRLINIFAMGGVVFWSDIANVNGWRLRKNWVFGNCRILDPADVRRAWGGETSMLKAFERLEQSLL